MLAELHGTALALALARTKQLVKFVSSDYSVLGYLRPEQASLLAAKGGFRGIGNPQRVRKLQALPPEVTPAVWYPKHFSQFEQAARPHISVRSKYKEDPSYLRNFSNAGVPQISEGRTSAWQDLGRCPPPAKRVVIGTRRQ